MNGNQHPSASPQSRVHPYLFRSLPGATIHEEMNVNLVRAEYALRKSKPNSVIKAQITNRLQFVLALYPENEKAKELLTLVEKG